MMPLLVFHWTWHVLLGVLLQLHLLRASLLSDLLCRH